MSNYDRIKNPSKGGGEVMPQVLSTDSFNMGERGRVDIEIAFLNSYVLSRSRSVNRYTFYNQGIT